MPRWIFRSSMGFSFCFRTPEPGIVILSFAFALSLAAQEPELRIAPLPGSNAWTLTLQGAQPSNAYTLAEASQPQPGAWSDTLVLQAAITGEHPVALLTPRPEETRRFFIIRESSAEDFDRDGLDNRAEFDAGADPHRGDTDGDLLSDGEEIHQTATDPTRPGDGAALIEETRQMLVAKWALLDPHPPRFRHPPGSPDDLADLEQLLRALSGAFHTHQE